MSTLSRRASLAALFPALMAQAAPPSNPVWDLRFLKRFIHGQRQEYGGARYAVLDGDRDAPGQPFTYAFWMPGGLWVPAHTHTQQAHVAVLSGTLLLGFGKTVDPKNVQRISAGGYFILRAGEPHFEGSEGETLIVGTALAAGKPRCWTSPGPFAHAHRPATP